MAPSFAVMVGSDIISDGGGSAFRQPSILRNGPDAVRQPNGDGVERPSVTWDEEQLAQNEIDRQRSPRMKIEMPDTPFLYYDSRAEPDDQFKTAEPTDKIAGPDGDMVPRHFDANSLQQRLGLVKLLQDAEQAFEKEQEEQTDQPPPSAVPPSDDKPVKVQVAEDIPQLNVPAGGASEAVEAALRLLECTRMIEVRGEGKGADAVAEVWMQIVARDAGFCDSVKTGLRDGKATMAVKFRNPYVALEVDRRSGASVPSTAFEAKRKALYCDQAANFRAMLAKAHAGDDDDDDDDEDDQ